MQSGIYTPSVTPLRSDGSIDFDAWGPHIDHLVTAGITGILIFGSIGEFYAFSRAQKEEAIDFAVERISHRTQLLVGTGSTRLSDTVKLGQYAARAGADGAVVISPYYFGPSDEAAFRYFGRVVAESELPVVLYNFPARTGSDLGASLVQRLAEAFPQIIGMKDTVDTISHTREVIEAAGAVRDDFAVFSGFDEYYVPNRIAGGAGIISGLTNIAPELFVELNTAWDAGDFATVHKDAGHVSRLMRIYQVGDLFVQTIKAGVNARGTSMSAATSEPCVPLSRADLEEIQRIVSEV
ncbi:dihydrodipicolinate synthase family protein [Neoactinobaculum massilliense]|uniref:dihydrodipicolinate synthase family protein n=1 Tax=Neoactinobaculum massilliense TaxID=2364794 RepID=UPI000F53AA01|nr:dihydrodipicolinate synthase family protein [Neoactinobaculum massilliense]